MRKFFFCPDYALDIMRKKPNRINRQAGALCEVVVGQKWNLPVMKRGCNSWVRNTESFSSGLEDKGRESVRSVIRVPISQGVTGPHDACFGGDIRSIVPLSGRANRHRGTRRRIGECRTCMKSLPTTCVVALLLKWVASRLARRSATFSGRSSAWRDISSGIQLTRSKLPTHTPHPSFGGKLCFIKYALCL